MTELNNDASSLVSVSLWWLIRWCEMTQQVYQKSYIFKLFATWSEAVNKFICTNPKLYVHSISQLLYMMLMYILFICKFRLWFCVSVIKARQLNFWALLCIYCNKIKKSIIQRLQEKSTRSQNVFIKNLRLLDKFWFMWTIHLENMSTSKIVHLFTLNGQRLWFRVQFVILRVSCVWIYIFARVITSRKLRK